MPVEIRTGQGVLFAAKGMLSSSEWGFEKRSLWVDTDNNTLTCGDDEVMKVRIANQNSASNMAAPGKISSWQEMKGGPRPSRRLRRKLPTNQPKGRKRQECPALGTAPDRD